MGRIKDIPLLHYEIPMKRIKVVPESTDGKMELIDSNVCTSDPARWEEKEKEMRKKNDSSFNKGH